MSMEKIGVQNYCSEGERGRPYRSEPEAPYVGKDLQVSNLPKGVGFEPLGGGRIGKYFSTDLDALEAGEVIVE